MGGLHLNVKNGTSREVQYYNTNIQDYEGDQKKLFNTVDKLLNRGKPTALPEHDKLTNRKPQLNHLHALLSQMCIFMYQYVHVITST